MKDQDRLREIVSKAPVIEAFRGQWMFHGTSCCWWTVDPADFGHHESGLPCCPHCGSLLLQVPLSVFEHEARARPGNYGPGGLASLVEAHHSTGRHYTDWDEIPIEEVNDA